MTNSNKAYSQFELFPVKSQDSAAPAGRARVPINDLTLSVENIIVVCIVLMMAFVLFFSFGVERGRRIASAAQTTAKTAEGEAAQPFVREETETIKVDIDPNELASESEEAAEDREIIQVPIEKQLTEEQLFTIQVASFKTKSHAQKEAEIIGKTGTETFVLPKGSYSIVCVGKFAERAKADQFSRTLKSKYRDLLVRRL